VPAGQRAAGPRFHEPPTLGRMADVQITVRGSYTAYAPPERGTVHARVGIEGPAAENVYAHAARAAQELGGDIGNLHDPTAGPVTWWSSGQLRTWAHRPWNQDGKQLPLVHHAEVTFAVKFSDFAQLSAFATRAVATTGVTVERIEWALTEARKASMTGDVRARAVRDARDKAQAYADALELGPVRVVALADAGMLGDGLHPSGDGGMRTFGRSAGAAGGADVQFVPDDISVAVQVDARFGIG